MDFRVDSLSDDEARRILREILGDKRILLIMSQSLKSTYEKREQEIDNSQKMLQSELRKHAENQDPNMKFIFRLQENMNAIYATMNREVRFLQLMIEAVALNNIDQPEPEPIGPNTKLTEEHKRILDWLVKYMQHKPEEIL